ncbi:RNA-binding domain-containing protein, partial [Polychaeton citri CBS 116435]
ANLFIGNLSWSVDEEWLTREFEGFGALSGVRIITDRDSGRSKGFGYIEFTNAEDAAAALEAKAGTMLDNREIRLDFSTPRGQQNGTPREKSGQRAQQYGDQTGEPTNTLFVGNLAFSVEQNAVWEAFQEYGTVSGVRLPTDRETGAPKGFGYVEMGSVDEAKAALEGLQGGEIDGRPMRLDYAGAKPQNNGGERGGRGGFGGGRGGGGRGGGFGRGGGGFGGGRGGGRGGARGGRPPSTNRGGFGDFSGKKTTF